MSASQRVCIRAERILLAAGLAMIERSASGPGTLQGRRCPGSEATWPRSSPVIRSR